METKKIQVYVLPRIAIEDTTVKDDTLVISIGSPGVEGPNIRGTYVYEFKFHDIREEYFLENVNMLIRPMEYEIAQQIVEVALRHRDKSEWVIHCEAGVSRSPGVALGLSRYIDMHPDTSTLQRLFPCYNSHVRKHVERALREKLEEIGEL